MKPDYRLIESLLREVGEPSQGFMPQGGSPQVGMQQPISSPAGSQDINMLLSMLEAALRSYDFNAIETIKGQIRALVQQPGAPQNPPGRFR